MRSFFQAIQLNGSTKAYLAIVGAFWLGCYVGNGSAGDEMTSVMIFLMAVPPLFVVVAIVVSAFAEARRASKDKD